MQRFRRFGIIALVTVALTGCGAASPTVSGTPGPLCPTYRTGPTTTPPPVPTTACETSAEIRAGQVLVRDPTIPETVLVQNNITLTVASGDTPGISKQKAEQIAEKHSAFGPAKSAIFGELHNQDGTPLHGQLVWLVDLTPPGPTTAPGNFGSGPEEVTAVLFLINARTGAPMNLRVVTSANQ